MAEFFVPTRHYVAAAYMIAIFLLGQKGALRQGLAMGALLAALISACMTPYINFLTAYKFLPGI